MYFHEKLRDCIAGSQGLGIGNIACWAAQIREFRGYLCERYSLHLDSGFASSFEDFEDPLTVANIPQPAINRGYGALTFKISRG
jgi:hypothetical protein